MNNFFAVNSVQMWWSLLGRCKRASHHRRHLRSPLHQHLVRHRSRPHRRRRRAPFLGPPSPLSAPPAAAPLSPRRVPTPSSTQNPSTDIGSDNTLHIPADAPPPHLPQAEMPTQIHHLRGGFRPRLALRLHGPAAAARPRNQAANPGGRAAEAAAAAPTGILWQRDLLHDVGLVVRRDGVESVGVRRRKSARSVGTNGRRIHEVGAGLLGAAAAEYLRHRAQREQRQVPQLRDHDVGTAAVLRGGFRVGEAGLRRSRGGAV